MAGDPLEMLDEDGQFGAPRGRQVGGRQAHQPRLLFTAPVQYGVEGRRLEEQHRVEAGEGFSIRAGQGGVGGASPCPLPVSFGLQGVDGRGEVSLGLRRRAQAPAVDQHRRRAARKHRPVRFGRAIIGQLVEGGKRRAAVGAGGAQGGQGSLQQAQIMRPRRAAYGEQGMDLAGQGLALGPGQIDVV